MRFITEEEKNAMVTSPMGNRSAVRNMLMQMKVGDNLLLEPSDWTWKTAKPSFLCRRLEANSDKKFECVDVLEPTPGWVITRVK